MKEQFIFCQWECGELEADYSLNLYTLYFFIPNILALINSKTYEQSPPGEVHDGKHLKPPAKDKLHPLRSYGVPLGVFPDARTNTNVPRSILFLF